MANIITIPAKPPKGNTVKKQEIKKLRVAAYVRVSTDTEEQSTSYEAQYEHYQEYISHNPEWQFAGIYADDGISAVNTKKREEFNRMIQDCMDGKIDMLITKSISRFARNTVDCLRYVRMLRDKNIPIFFEKEGINSMDKGGEIMLTIMASMAQQESESISQNVKIGIQYRFQQGKIMVNCACFLGYDKDEDGNLVINPEQAEVVKRIFLEYLEGASCLKIAKGLERDGIRTARGSTKWHDKTIRQILENEKYMGDALLQKTITVNLLEKKRTKNTGALPQYYVEDSHPTIIPKELFMQVQEEIVRRSTNRSNKCGHSSNTCFSQMVFCGDCGEPFRRVHWNNRGKRSIVWRCTSRLDKKEECIARTVHEETLEAAFMEALNRLQIGKTEYLKKLQDNLENALNSCNIEEQERIDTRLGELQRILLEKSNHHENYDDVAEEILSLREKKEKCLMDGNARKQFVKRIKELQEIILEKSTGFREFDETLVKHLLAKVTVFEEHMMFEFKSGISVEVNM
ncbi:MAG: recombinase family protein [Ruminococcus flavefaciens]|nr:recombinase family protein [Ruminococcus flavefaciens]MCM1061082.1 recombinase family protein [Eubacterium sp.]